MIYTSQAIQKTKKCQHMERQHIERWPVFRKELIVFKNFPIPGISPNLKVRNARSAMDADP